VSRPVPPASDAAEAPGSRIRAAAETAAAAAVYIGVALAAVRWVDVSDAVSWLGPGEADVVSGFVVGSLAQVLALVLVWVVLRPVALAEAVGAIRVPSTREGWSIAATIVAVEAVVMLAFFLDVGWRALEPSALNLTGSAAPLLGTLGLGAALGWAFIRGGYSLRPAIAAHVAILVIVQPWLALGP
jgi:hypothetical protein